MLVYYVIITSKGGCVIGKKGYLVYDIELDQVMSLEESEQFIANRGNIKREKTSANTKSHKPKSNLYWDYGNFYLFKYDNKIFEDLQGADLVRLLYLASYMRYSKDGNYLLKGTRPMNKNACAKAMNLKETAFREFWNKCISLDLLEVDSEGNVSVTGKYFYKGKITSTAARDNLSMVRINTDTIKDLYHATESKGHKRLSQIYRLIRFVDKKTNIVCMDEITGGVGELPTRADICNMIGSKGINSENKLRDLFDDFVVMYLGDEYKAVDLKKDQFEDKYRMTINPMIFYRGDDFRSVLTRVFKREKE